MHHVIVPWLTMREALPAFQSSLHSHPVINASLAAQRESLRVLTCTADVGQLQHLGKTIFDVLPTEYCPLQHLNHQAVNNVCQCLQSILVCFVAGSA